MTYDANVKALAEGAAEQVDRLFSALGAGKLSYDEFAQAAATVISAAMGKGSTLAELTLAGYLQKALGYVPAFAAVPPSIAAERLLKAISTITASELDTRMQLDRLARSEVLKSAASTYDEAIRRSSHVRAYTRGLEADACELCVWLYKDGYEYPANQPMHRHTGCTCHQVPVIRK